MTMNKPILFALAGIAAVAGSAPALAAASNPGKLDVKLTVTTGCDINGNGGIGVGTGSDALLDFGSHAAGETSSSIAGADTGTTLTVTCSGTQTPSLAFDGGQNPQVGQRNLKQISGQGLIPYILGSVADGDDYELGVAIPLAAFAAGKPRVVKVYGSIVGDIPAEAEGAYTDAVTISLTW